MRSQRLALGVATVAVFGSLLIAAGPAGAVTTLSVTPDTGLAGGQVVQVAGAGLIAGHQVGWCEGAVSVPPSFESCDRSSIAETQVAPDGTFGGALRLRRFIYVPALGTWIDCVASPQRCVIGTGDINDLAGTAVTVPLSFAEPPPPPATRGTISLSPSTGLDPGDLVTVSGSGFRADAAIELFQCVPGPGAPADPTTCAPSTSFATADASGAFQAGMPVYGTLDVPGQSSTDCFTGASGQCRVVAAEAVDFPGTAVGLPISFAGPPPVVLPGSGLVAAPASGTADLTVSVTLDKSYSKTVTVPWTTFAVPGLGPSPYLGPEAPPSDYTASSGVVTFVAGQTSAQVTIPVSGCTGGGDLEFVLISFNHPTNATMGGFWGLGFGIIVKGT